MKEGIVHRAVEAIKRAVQKPEPEYMRKVRLNTQAIVVKSDEIERLLSREEASSRD